MPGLANDRSFGEWRAARAVLLAPPSEIAVFCYFSRLRSAFDDSSTWRLETNAILWESVPSSQCIYNIKIVSYASLCKLTWKMAYVKTLIYCRFNLGAIRIQATMLVKIIWWQRPINSDCYPPKKWITRWTENVKLNHLQYAAMSILIAILFALERTSSLAYNESSNNHWFVSMLL